MEFNTFLIQLLNGVQYGLLLFLVSSGLTLVFGIMGVINVAHGSFYMIGAYLAWWLTAALGSFWLALPAAIVLTVAIGLALEALLIKRLYRRDHLYQVLLTYGLILVFEETRSILWGEERWKLFSPFELVWAGGATGRAAGLGALAWLKENRKAAALE